MTLVIAGYDYEKPSQYTWGASDTSTQDESEMEHCGLFVVADGSITQNQGNGSKTLLDGFQKVYCIKTKLWKPYFMPDGSFKDYREIHEQREVFVAFAGSTLTAHHIINSIREHLENLRISFGKRSNGSIYYNAVRHCQKNPLLTNRAVYFEDDTFLPRDFKGLLTGRIISKTAEYSINRALLSAGRTKTSMDEFKAMHTELVLGLWCPYKNRYELHLYRMLIKPGDDKMLIAYTKGKRLKSKEIAVLGMHNRFEDAAQKKLENSIKNNLSPSAALHQFLKDSIDEVQKSGSNEINYPTSLTLLNKFCIRRVS